MNNYYRFSDIRMSKLIGKNESDAFKCLSQRYTAGDSPIKSFESTYSKLKKKCHQIRLREKKAEMNTNVL